MTASAAKAPERNRDPEGIVFVEARWHFHQTYRADPLLQRFFAEIKAHKRLVGAVVPGTGRVLFPPRSFCEQSYRQATEIVDVGPRARICAFTRIMTEFPGAPPPPLLLAFVQPEGASTSAPAYVRGAALDSIALLDLVGAWCRPVFKPVPNGDWDDFWFELEE